MSATIRPATTAELPALNDLCLRSKAHWGYDKEFMQQCVAELTIAPEELTTSAVMVAEVDGQIAGIVQMRHDGPDAELAKIFVEPELIGNGIGRLLFDWAKDWTLKQKLSGIVVDSDPQAADFYRQMGARDIGLSPSGSIPGRMLPMLRLDLS